MAGLETEQRVKGIRSQAPFCSTSQQARHGSLLALSGPGKARIAAWLQTIAHLVNKLVRWYAYALVWTLGPAPGCEPICGC